MAGNQPRNPKTEASPCALGLNPQFRSTLHHKICQQPTTATTHKSSNTEGNGGYNSRCFENGLQDVELDFHETQPSLRTLFPNTISFPKMPRPAFDFMPYAPAILEYRRLGWDASEILTALRLTPTKWTLNRWLAKNSPDTKYRLTKDTALLGFIRDQWAKNRTQEQILEAVNNEFRPTGGDISTRQLKVLRHSEGLLFRRRGGIGDEERERKIRGRKDGIGEERAVKEREGTVERVEGD